MVALLKSKPLISIRRVKNDAELEAVQRLRYEVFFEEFGATPINDTCRDLRRDIDPYDDVADHLVVLSQVDDEELIIGTYRLLRQDQAESYNTFNSQKMYDLTPFYESGQTLLELSRSCVLADYRTRNVLKILWQGIANYINEHKIELMFGCASFHGTDPKIIADQLAYLHHYHLAPSAIRCRARDEDYVDMNMMDKESINVRKTFQTLPPLLKGYLRVGSSVGKGAVIDPQFATIDVLITMQTHMLTGRYSKHYEVQTDILAENSKNITKS